MEYVVHATKDCLHSSHPQQSMLIIGAVTAAIFLPAAQRAELSANELPENPSAVRSSSWLLPRPSHSTSSSYVSIFVIGPLVSFSFPRWVHNTFVEIFLSVRWVLSSSMWYLSVTLCFRKSASLDVVRLYLDEILWKSCFNSLVKGREWGKYVGYLAPRRQKDLFQILWFLSV